MLQWNTQLQGTLLNVSLHINLRTTQQRISTLSRKSFLFSFTDTYTGLYIKHGLIQLIRCTCISNTGKYLFISQHKCPNTTWTVENQAWMNICQFKKMTVTSNNKSHIQLNVKSYKLMYHSTALLFNLFGFMYLWIHTEKV